MQSRSDGRQHNGNMHVARLLSPRSPAIAALWLMAISTIAVTEPASADCLKNLHGEVYCGAGDCRSDRSGRILCSRHFMGGAVRRSDGKVVCGKGRCINNSSGEIWCSNEIGGAVLVDLNGRVRCQGRCEPGSIGHCESRRAGSSR